MVEYSVNPALDEIDLKILRSLQQDGRMSNVDLARYIELSPPATYARVRRLEEQGFIRRYVALLDPELAGFDLLCFVRVNLQLHQSEQVEGFRKAIAQMPEVLECHHVTGDYDYLLKVALRNRKDLERFAVERLTPIPGVARIYTSLVLRVVKETTALPLE
jgi:Lrp/AsnC family transcriptional regulator, leucine-responsive regulatory protein